MHHARELVSSRPISSDAGLLVLRVGVGLSMIAFHGWGKLSGGPEQWEKVGGAMANLGLDFAPVFWGLMAALAESACAVLLVIGILTRPAAALLAATMLVAAVAHLARPEGAPGAGWSGASHALELLAVSICLLLTGPGRFSLAAFIHARRAPAVPSPS
jgi:putative oxidoreductase